MTDEAFYAYVSIPSTRAFNHLDNDRESLATSPHPGQMHDPAYEAARPPLACRVLYRERYGIYYRVDEAARRVVAFAMEDQRRNPENRFSSYERATARLDPATGSDSPED